MSIFLKPISDISFEDILSFCKQGVQESVNLDYKQDFPSDLEKTVSAFANTYGGVIIIGVADDDGKPKPPFEGIAYQRGLEERVTNISINSIFPPIVPEVVVCKGSADKVFVVIRVTESDQTPHAVAGNTKAYIRTGKVSKPEDALTFEQSDWLIDRRRKSEQLRVSLLASAESHYSNVAKHKGHSLGNGELTISLAPLFPNKPMFSLPELPSLIQECSVKNKLGDQFPLITDDFQPIKDGYYSTYRNPTTQFGYYLELNQFGLVYQKESLCWSNKSNLEGTNKIRLIQIFDRLDLALEAIANIYKRVGYWGLVSVQVSLKKILGLYVATFRARDYEASNDSDVNIADDALEWQYVLPVTQIVDPKSRQGHFTRIFSEIAWALGVPTQVDRVNRKLIERDRFVA